LEVEDRQIEIAVAEVIAPRAMAIELSHLLHAEDLDEEFCRGIGVLRRDCDVLDLRHGVAPFLSGRGSSIQLAVSPVKLERRATPAAVSPLEAPHQLLRSPRNVLPS